MIFISKLFILIHWIEDQGISLSKVIDLLLVLIQFQEIVPDIKAKFSKRPVDLDWLRTDWLHLTSEGKYILSPLGEFLYNLSEGLPVDPEAPIPISHMPYCDTLVINRITNTLRHPASTLSIQYDVFCGNCQHQEYRYCKLSKSSIRDHVDRHWYGCTGFKDQL